MKFVNTAILIFLLLFTASSVYSGSINVDDPALMKEAIDFLNSQANMDTMILTVSGGVYTTHDTLFYEIKKPLTILAAAGLAEKPIITHSDDSTNVLEMFRCYESLTVEGVVFDGWHEQTHGLKYAVRVGNGPDDAIMVKAGLDLTFRDCDFINFGRDKDVMQEGHAIYFLKDIATVGTVRIENCNFTNIRDEAIRMTETEKYATERCLDSLIVRNCTFEDIEAECVRFYADTDENTEDAVLIIENCTVNNSAPRFCYIKNNMGTMVRNILVTNGRLSQRRLDRNDYVFEVQQVGSFLSNCDTLNLAFDPATKRDDVFRSTKGAEQDKSTFWGFDPMYADAANGDFTLQAASHAYYSGYDGNALGDLRWATNTPTVVPFMMTVDGNGMVEYDPAKEGNVFDPGTVVTMTAVPDSGWSFAGWSGTLTGSDNPASVTVNDSQNITATFTEGTTGVVDEGALPIQFALRQNYPNPFNPSTSIPFVLPQSGNAKLEVFDILGQKVMTVFNRHYTAGEHRAFITAKNLAAGVYYYQLTAGEHVSTKKMILLK